jgi:SnoaL-like protein
MRDFAADADQLFAAYNAKDFAALERLISPAIAFEHCNRGYAFSTRDALLGVLREFAEKIVPDRRFTGPVRTTVMGNRVVREARWGGTAHSAVPTMAEAGGRIDLLLCSVLTFDDDGVLVEWKDYG